jgi:hypothetical protein
LNDLREQKRYSVLRRPRIEIANSADAPNPLGAIALRTKLATKVANVEVDTSIERGEFSVENILDKCLTGQNLTGRFEKHAQQIELRSGQPERLTRLRYCARCQIEFDIAGMDHRGAGCCIAFGLPSGPAEYGRDSGDQFAGTERLWQVVIGAEFKAQDSVELVPFRRKHQNRRSNARSDFSQNIKALLIWQHDVQNDQFMVAFNCCLHSFAPGMDNG